jgi:Ca2+/H+ antiporter
MSEALVGAAEPTGQALGMSEAFIGIVFLALIGGAADRRSNWYKGVQLILTCAMIAILFYFLPAAAGT